MKRKRRHCDGPRDTSFEDLLQPAEDLASCSSAGSRPLSRRAFLGTMGSVFAGAALAACAPGLQGPGPRGSETVQLVYSDWQTDWFAGMAQQMLEQFHAANPNIQVFFTPDPDDLAEPMAEIARIGRQQRR